MPIAEILMGIGALSTMASGLIPDKTKRVQQTNYTQGSRLAGYVPGQTGIRKNNSAYDEQYTPKGKALLSNTGNLFSAAGAITGLASTKFNKKDSPNVPSNNSTATDKTGSSNLSVTNGYMSAPLGLIGSQLTYNEPINVQGPGPYQGSYSLSRDKKTQDAYISGLNTYSPYFESAASKYNQDPEKLALQAFQESNFDLSARSNQGATGIMQIMPQTLAHIKKLNPSFSDYDVNDPAQNIEMGAYYMNWINDQLPKDKRSWENQLAAYHMGVTGFKNVGYDISQAGPNTRQYVDYVTGRYKYYPKYYGTR